MAQGEDLPIFFRLVPNISTERFDSVWFETDEGITTDSIENPPYNQTCQLIFTSDLTSEFSTGDHHVRLWGELGGLKYVLTELIISVNPAFPFTSESTDIDYEYQSQTSSTVYSESAEVTVETNMAKIATVAQWSHNSFEVGTVDDLPSTAQVGDIAKVTSFPESYWIRVNSGEWVQLTFKSDEHISINDNVYMNCQPFELTE